MKPYRLTFKKGFTLVELMVVVTIIAILSFGALGYLMNARKDARDTIRVNEAAQLKLGIRLYKESYGTYPDYPNGVQLGVGEDIDDDLAPFIKNVPSDPLSTGDASSEYGYWYYSDFNCNGDIRNVITITKMEYDGNANFDDVCGSGATQLPSNFDWKFINYAYAAAPGTKCANEGSTCTFSGTRSIGYGAEPNYIYKTFTGSAACTNGAFGSDPYYGVVKACYDTTIPLYTQSTYAPAYSQSTYYTQSTYAPAYTQSRYYSQSSYYTQSSYATGETSNPWGSSASNVYILFVN